MEAASREVELVVRTARPGMDAVERDGIRSLVGGGMDWDAVLEFARVHGVIPLLYRRLEPFDSAVVPPAVQERLREAYRSNGARNLHLTHRLHQLCGRFANDGLRALPFKGPVLAEWAYGDVARRTFGDLDLLVHRDDVSAAVDVLQSMGYEWHDGTPRLDDLALLGGPFTRPIVDEYALRDGDVEVEVRWRVGSDARPFGLGVDTLWSRRELVEVAGARLPALAPDDRLLVLAFHGAKHGWHKLKWVVDLAASVQRGDPFEWSSVLDRATRYGSRRKLLVGFALAESLLAVEPPVAIANAIGADGRARALARESETRLVGGTTARPGWIEKTAYNARASDSLADAGAVLAHVPVLHPSLADYQRLPLRGPLHPVYYLLRPFRLMADRASLALGG